jgi:glutamyl-tRNA(Gln) amidotransferase subunit D
MESPGDTVRVATSEEGFEGVLMPQAGGFLVIKLPNGYNIGIDRKKITDIRVVKKYGKKETKPAGMKQKKGLPTISILHTGGTIASKVDYATGGVNAKFSPEELLSLFPELGEMANIRSRLVANLMSENLRFAHYNILAKEIEREVAEGADGIIVTHGTDTLHYSSAALSFALENPHVPVILVGAQRSSDRGSTDAAVNIISAAIFICHSKFAGVATCMHESMSDDTCLLIRGAKARKMHTSRRDAFRPINAKPLARVNFAEKKVEFLRESYPASVANGKPEGKFAVMPFRESIKVGIIKCHTNMYASQFLSYLGFDGVVLELTGLGQGPIISFDEHTRENENIRKAIGELVKTGTIVAAAPQTIYGRLQMNVYSEGRRMQELGVIGNYSDMTPETSFIKLAWLLSNFKKEQVPELFSTNLRGEISERTLGDTYLK